MHGIHPLIRHRYVHGINLHVECQENANCACIFTTRRLHNSLFEINLQLYMVHVEG